MTNAKKQETAKADQFAQTISVSFIDRYIDNPGAFVVPSAQARAAAMELVEKTYDAANYLDKFGLFDDWKSVKDSGFDSNMQLWELISFRNEPVLKFSTDTMKQLSALIESVQINSDSDEDQTVVSLGEGDSSDSSSSGSGEEMVDEYDEESVDEEQPEDAAESLELDSEQGSGLENESEAGTSSDLESDEEEEDEEEEVGSTAKRSIVDDDFFSLAEMEKFADDAEEEDMRDRAILAGDYPQPQPGENNEDEESSDEDSDDIDLFQDIDDDSDMDDDEKGNRAEEMKYSDFYKAPKGSKRAKAKESREKHAKRVKFDPNVFDSLDEESDSEEQMTRKSNLFDDDDDDMEQSSDVAGETKSEFEKRQEKLQGLISKLEDEAVEKKDWVMTGEVTSTERPKNSLLAEDLDFEYTQKPTPVITQETTQTLEDIIKRRILNEEWDDVERKKDIQQKPFRPSEFIELDDKKSKKSLAEVYEDQFMAEKAGDDYVPEDDAKVAEAHREVDSQFRNLFAQLDALSNFHFAPRPATADIEIRTSAPALQMEEKLPVTMTTAEQLAPEEVFEKNQGRNGRTGDLMGETELTREDRKRRRQKKKAVQKKKNTETAAKKTSSSAKPASAAAADKKSKPGSKPKATA
ncbi:U3 snoRNP protein [Coemansia asiatica]|uniref:U3 small nucleolar ribonucleoprotein protein MPP10 n=1 Tax=Coemansia asiatica TaxID=1052880 RepID=A0A9W7XM94_9FUNG|nr:U3 snoRNP protein [Coemansia asiatica]